MTTIRRRLTLWYTVALGVTILAFGTLLYLERRQSSLRELDQRLGLEADLANRWLSESYNVLGRIVTTAGERPALDPGISAYLEAVRDYLVVTDTIGNVLALSEAGRTLTADALQRLTAPLDTLRLPKRAGTMRLDGLPSSVRYLAVRVEGAGPEVGGLLVATSTDQVAFGPSELVRSMLLIAPVILAAAALLGYWLAGTSLRPVQGIMDEVEDISDGTSLHRRLAVPLSGDEMARLAQTVNGMLARLEQSFASLHRFTADASHELKTPLMVLRAGVERALVHPGIPAEILQSLDDTLAQINEMTELVESLLTLARADEGRAPLAVEESDLRDLLGDVAETAGMLGEGVGITVTSTMPDRRCGCRWTGTGSGELLLNLVTNAIKYTPQGGTVDADPGRSGWRGHLHRARHRDRHRTRRPAPHLRALLARRPRTLPDRRPAWHGTRARDHQVDRGGAWRLDHGAEPARPRYRVHRAAAARRPAAGALTPAPPATATAPEAV